MSPMLGSRTRAGLLLALLAAAGCGDDAPAMDAGPADTGAADAGLPACTYVDGRGGPAADGSAGAPFANLDDALATGALRVCLAAGAFAPPTAPITGTVRIEGLGSDASQPTASSIDGGLGSCLPVTVPGLLSTDPSVSGDTVLKLDPTANVSLAGLRLRGCDLGVAVEGGALTAEDVGIDSVRGGVAAYASSTVHLSEVTMAVNSRLGGLTSPLPAGVLGLGRSDLTIVGGHIQGLDVSMGVVAVHSPLSLEGTEIEGGLYGFFTEQGVGSGITTRIGEGTFVHGLRPVVGGPSGEFVAGNQIRGGAASVTGARFEDVDGSCLELHRVLGVMLADLQFVGCTRGGLELYRAEADLTGESRFDIPPGAAGLYLSDHTLDNPERGPSALRVVGGVSSRAGAHASHATAVGSSLRFESSALDLAGGQLGLSALGGGSVEVLAGGRIHDPSATAGASIEEATLAVFVADDGSSFHATDLQMDLGEPTWTAFGVFAGDASQVELTGGVIRGGMAGLLGLGQVDLHATDLEVAGAGVNGVALLGGSASLTSVRVHDVLGAGLVASDGATLALDRALVANNGRSGVEAHTGARLEILGSTFEANTGAGVAFYDAAGFVASSMFSVGSSMADFAGQSRADEVRVVSTGLTTRDVFLGDDGDGTIMPDEENRFELDARAGCAAGGCTLVLGDGGGVHGITSPNCIVGAAAGGAVHTVVSQNGASMSVVGGSAGTAWADALGGIAADLGLSAGSPGATAAIPTPTRPSLDEFTFSP